MTAPALQAAEAPAAEEAAAPAAEEAPAETEAPPAEEEGAAPAEEGEPAPAEEGAAPEEEGPPAEPKEPMTEEEAAIKIQSHARGMVGREHVEKDKGYRNPNIGKPPEEAGEEAGEPPALSEEEVAAQEVPAASLPAAGSVDPNPPSLSSQEARLAAEAEAAENADRERRKALDLGQCKLQGPALLKCVAGCHSHFFLQCVNGGGDPVRLPLRRS